MAIAPGLQEAPILITARTLMNAHLVLLLLQEIVGKTFPLVVILHMVETEVYVDTTLVQLVLKTMF